MMMQIDGIDITKIENEYKYEFNMFEEHDIFSYLDCLSEAETRILVLYCELQSYRRVAEKLGVGASTVSNYLNKIKLKLKKNGLSRNTFNFN